MKLKFKYHDEIGITRCLGIFEQAAAQCFGIAAGWLNTQGLFEMYDAGFAEEGNEVFQIGCIPCEKAYRFASSKLEIENFVLGRNGVAWHVINDFRNDAPCRHLDQFLAFAKGVQRRGKYSIAIAQEICERAKWIKEQGNKYYSCYE